MKKTQILKISDIVWDKEIYPRINPNWQVSLSYKNAMKSGSKFPPITVALYKKKYTLIDGKHRINAYKQMKEKYVKAEILKGLTRNQMFVEAVKRNTAHGLQLSVFERTNIILKLEDLGYNPVKISDIINMPVKEVTSFKVGKVTDTISGKEVGLKPEFRHLRETTVGDDFDEVQKPYKGATQVTLIKDLNNLISNKLINLKNRKVMFELRILYKLLSKYKSITKP